MQARFVKAILMGNKNDVMDVRAIWMAVQQPSKKIVVKSEQQQTDWKDGRGRCRQDDSDALARIHNVIDKPPTYGYRRVWAILRRRSENEGIATINTKRVYHIMKQAALLLERKPAIPVSIRAHTGKVAVNESNQR